MRAGAPESRLDLFGDDQRAGLADFGDRLIEIAGLRTVEAVTGEDRTSEESGRLVPSLGEPGDRQTILLCILRGRQLRHLITDAAVLRGRYGRHPALQALGGNGRGIERADDRRIAMEGCELADLPDVVALCMRAELADGHVPEHPPAQRRDGVRAHKRFPTKVTPILRRPGRPYLIRDAADTRRPCRESGLVQWR
jgi:hypothetical protein